MSRSVEQDFIGFMEIVAFALFVFLLGLGAWAYFKTDETPQVITAEPVWDWYSPVYVMRDVYELSEVTDEAYVFIRVEAAKP